MAINLLGEEYETLDEYVASILNPRFNIKVEQ